MKKSEFNYSVFIGRFQPFHNAHLNMVLGALTFSKKLIIIVGSQGRSKTIRNPWNFNQRKLLIEKSIPEEYRNRISIYPVRDTMYNHLQWITNVQNVVNSHILEDENPNPKISITGFYKDDSSEYLNFFPQWQLVTQTDYKRYNGTDIRNSMFRGEDDWISSVPSNIVDDLRKLIDTPEFKNLIEEYNFTEKYKELWKDSPFPPTFITTDTAVIKSGHVLLVERGFNPGKGLYALPGGFVAQEESLEQSAIRELKEETKIDISKAVLRRSIVESKIFDHPHRSLRGRTITNAYLIDLGKSGELPEVKGADDAKKAFWVPIADIVHYEDKFFEDHLYIITHFTSKR